MTFVGCKKKQTKTNFLFKLLFINIYKKVLVTLKHTTIHSIMEYSVSLKYVVRITVNYIETCLNVNMIVLYTFGSDSSIWWGCT